MLVFFLLNSFDERTLYKTEKLFYFLGMGNGSKIETLDPTWNNLTFLPDNLKVKLQAVQTYVKELEEVDTAA